MILWKEKGSKKMFFIYYTNICKTDM